MTGKEPHSCSWQALHPSNEELIHLNGSGKEGAEEPPSHHTLKKSFQYAEARGPAQGFQIPFSGVP